VTLGAPLFKAGLKAAADTVWSAEGVLTGYGMPGFDAYDDIIAFGAVTSDAEPATLGTRRTREETLTCEVTFYIFRGGGQEQEVVVETRFYTLLNLLAESVRVTDTTLGGVVRECFLTSYASDQATDQSVLSKGRLQVGVATFTAKYRITS